MLNQLLIKLKRNQLKVSLVVGLLCYGAGEVHAQQDPYFTHYMFNKLQYNPAYAGASDKICFAGIFHTQWTGLEDNTANYQSDGIERSIETGVGPKTMGFAIDAPIWNPKGKFSLGAGFSVVQDDLGYESALKFRGALAGKYDLGNTSTIALGVEVGMLQKEIDGTKLLFLDPNDPNIPSTVENDANMNLAAGLYYTNPLLNDLYIGLSATNINEQKFEYGSGAISNMSKRHYYLVSGMKLPNFMGNPSLELQPSLLVKMNSTVQATLSGIVEYNNLYAGGIAYRSEIDAVSILLGYRLQEDLRIGYSYDVTLNQLGRYSGGTHEFQVNYCFEIPTAPAEPPHIELTPRFLNKDPNID